MKVKNVMRWIKTDLRFGLSVPKLVRKVIFDWKSKKKVEICSPVLSIFSITLNKCHNQTKSSMMKVMN